MYELAISGSGEQVILSDIAKRQKISAKYLSKLIIPLKAARLVTSSRGSHGGYTLARDPSQITLLDIVTILEGDITPVECVRNSNICEMSSSCRMRDIWSGLDKAIQEYLAGITLENIARGADAAENGAYCI
jgi:Rrf2 family protein